MNDITLNRQEKLPEIRSGTADPKSGSPIGAIDLNCETVLFRPKQYNTRIFFRAIESQVVFQISDYSYSGIFMCGYSSCVSGNADSRSHAGWRPIMNFSDN